MSPQGSLPTCYLFIDGSSLAKTIEDISKRFFDGAHLAIDWGKLRAINRKVYLYDAIPVQLPDEDENTYAARVAPKRKELAFIERQSGYHIRTGDVFRRRREGNGQKMVDVHLAVDALLMASRNLFSGCTLITSDLDFRPLISALVEMGIDTTLQYQPGHANNELLAAADNVIPTTLNFALSFLDLTPEQRVLIPNAAFHFQHEKHTIGEIVRQWEDPGYGTCKISTFDGKVRLTTSRSPQNGSTHRLIANAVNEVWLRAYVSETFGIEFPDG